MKKIKLKCLFCDKLFVPFSDKILFCSKICERKWRTNVSFREEINLLSKRGD